MLWTIPCTLFACAAVLQLKKQTDAAYTFFIFGGIVTVFGSFQ